MKQTDIKLIKSARRLLICAPTLSSFALSWHLMSEYRWTHSFIALTNKGGGGGADISLERCQLPSIQRLRPERGNSKSRSGICVVSLRVNTADLFRLGRGRLNVRGFFFKSLIFNKNVYDGKEAGICLIGTRLIIPQADDLATNVLKHAGLFI